MNEKWTILLLALALSLDAFAVCISCGIKIRQLIVSRYIKISLTFGLFQALMPIGGYLLGQLLSDYVGLYGKWISFFVFLILGIKTLYEAYKNKDLQICEGCQCNDLSCLSSLALATSIDAFIAGLVIAFYNSPLYFSLTVIGLTTFFMSIGGCYLGYRSNLAFRRRAIFLAGLILIGLALKSLS